MNYIKYAWKTSGSLELKKYFTLPNIIWTGLTAFLICESFFGALSSTNPSQIRFTDIIELVLIEIAFAIIWYLNCRFSPFCFNSLKINVKKDLNSIIHDAKDGYHEEMAKGPQTITSKIDPFGGDVKVTGKIKPSNFFNDRYTVTTKEESNWTSRTETNLEVKTRGVNSAIENGMVSTGATLIRSLYRYIAWPISFIYGWFAIRKFINYYQRSQNASQLNNKTSRFN